MGPYCRYCDTRCFVPDPWGEHRIGGARIILATCEKGKALDRERAGYDIDRAREMAGAR